MSPPYDLILHEISPRDHWVERANFLGVLTYLINEARNRPLEVLNFLGEGQKGTPKRGRPKFCRILS